MKHNKYYLLRLFLIYVIIKPDMILPYMAIFRAMQDGHNGRNLCFMIID
jgi:hypothetical protein